MALKVEKARGTRSQGRWSRQVGFHHVAGPVDACRTCGGAREAAGMICGGCKGEGRRE